jgi:hypothetical protein
LEGAGLALTTDEIEEVLDAPDFLSKLQTEVVAHPGEAVVAGRCFHGVVTSMPPPNPISYGCSGIANGVFQYFPKLNPKTW